MAFLFKYVPKVDKFRKYKIAFFLLFLSGIATGFLFAYGHNIIGWFAVVLLVLIGGILVERLVDGA